MDERRFLETAQIKSRSILPRWKINWRWMLAWEIPILLLCGAALQYWNTRPPIIPASLSVSILECAPGQLKMAWNPQAKSLAKAAHGEIEITDGIATQTIALTAEMLAKGSYTYPRATEDVDMRLIVTNESGNEVREGSRFVGQPVQPVVKSENVSGLDAESRDLQKQLQWLRKKREMQTQRIRELQLRLKIVEARLGIKRVP